MLDFDDGGLGSSGSRVRPSSFAKASLDDFAMSKRSAASAGLKAPVLADDDATEDEEPRGPVPPPGTIKRVKMTNLRCHSHCELLLGPRVNFICGLNGSGGRKLSLTVGEHGDMYPRLFARQIDDSSRDFPLSRCSNSEEQKECGGCQRWPPCHSYGDERGGG